MGVRIRRNNEFDFYHFIHLRNDSIRLKAMDQPDHMTKFL